MASTSREATDLSAASNASKSDQILASVRDQILASVCPIGRCKGTTEHYEPLLYDGRNEFIISTAFIRKCLTCAGISFICKICDEKYPCTDNTYIKPHLILYHAANHAIFSGSVQYGNVYIDFDCASNAIMNYTGKVTIGFSLPSVIHKFPHIVCVGGVDYRKICLEVALEYNMIEPINISSGGIAPAVYISGVAFRYFIELMQNAFLSEEYECMICGLMFECFPSVDVCRSHNETHCIMYDAPP